MKRRSWGEVFRNAAEGLVESFLTQRNLRVHTGCAVIAVFAGLFFHISRVDWMFICLAIAGVIITELLNTAVERVVDLASPEFHVLAKSAKDTAAGAVMLAAVFAVIIAVFVFWKPLITWAFY